MAAAPVQNVVIDREQSKIPLFHADPAHDSFQAEYWIDRLNRLQTANQWTDTQTLCHATNALRGDALHFIQYLINNFADQNAHTTNWPLFKQQFLLSFGKLGRDTSSIANLAILQRSTESVQKFAHRVAVTTNEFFDAVNIPDTPNFAAVAAHPGWDVILENDVAQAVITFYVRQTLQTLRNALDKTIFLNGLNSHINALVKNSAPATMTEAVETAVKIERNRRGPIDHTIALEKSNAKPSAQAVNAVRRGGSRGRGHSAPSSTRSEPAHTNGYRPPTNASKRVTDCWYCRKSGHVQRDCRKRIARGASTVPKPRSVAEITADNIGYQDGSDDEEIENDDDYDDYLENAINESPDMEVASLHREVHSVSLN